eukprot:scaffold340_cov256-Pinguiococcus_pyrenoidosus.AAC.6
MPLDFTSDSPLSPHAKDFYPDLISFGPEDDSQQAKTPASKKRRKGTSPGMLGKERSPGLDALALVAESENSLGRPLPPCHESGISLTVRLLPPPLLTLSFASDKAAGSPALIPTPTIGSPLRGSNGTPIYVRTDG